MRQLHRVGRLLTIQASLLVGWMLMSVLGLCMVRGLLDAVEAVLLAWSWWR